MRIEDDWVYPENMDDVRALGVILDGDQFEVSNYTGARAMYWQNYEDSVGKVMASKPNNGIEPIASRRPLRLYSHPTESEHFI